MSPRTVMITATLQRWIPIVTMAIMAYGFVANSLMAQTQDVTNAKVLLVQEWHEQRIQSLEKKFDYILLGVFGIVGTNVIGMVLKKTK